MRDIRLHNWGNLTGTGSQEDKLYAYGKSATVKDQATDDMLFAELRESGHKGSLDDMLYSYAAGNNGTPLPTMSMKFSGMTALHSDITHTRVSSGTYTDSAGVLQTAAVNQLTYSQDFSNAAWSKSNTSESASATLAPDGTATAFKVVPADSTGTYRELAQDISVVNGEDQTITYYVKEDTWRYCQIIGPGTEYGTFYVNFDSRDGSVTANVQGTGAALATASSEDVGGGWYRIQVTQAAKATSSTGRLALNFINGATDARGASVTGDGVLGLLVWQADHLTNASTAAPYVKTTTAVNSLPRFTHTATGSMGDGNELVTNGTFDSDATGWTLEADVTTAIVSNEVELTNIGANYGGIGQGFTTVVGRSYRASVEYTKGTANSGYLQLGTSLAGTDIASIEATSTQTITTDFVAVGSTSFVSLKNNNQNNATNTFDNISVQLIVPAVITAQGLMVEGSGTNLCLQSEDFSTTWDDDVTVTANTTLSPAGELTADTLTDDNASAFELRKQTFTIADDSDIRCFSVYVLKDAIAPATRYPRIDAVLSGGTGLRYIFAFDTSTGASNNTGDTVTAGDLEDAGLYWRVWFSFANNSTGNTNLVIEIYPSVGANADLETTSTATTGSIIASCTQLEAASAPSSYIATTTAAVTRAADVATISGTDFSSWFNATEGTFVVEAASNIINPTNNGRIFTAHDGSATDYIDIRVRGSSNESISVVRSANSEVFAAANFTNEITAGVNTKASIAYKLNDFAGTLDGEIKTDTSGAVPTGIDTLSIGNDAAGTANFNGTIKSIAYYPTRLSDATLQAVTL